MYLLTYIHIILQRHFWKPAMAAHSRLYCGRSLSRWLDYDGSQTWRCGAISTLMLLSWHTSVFQFFAASSSRCSSFEADPFFHQIVWKSLFFQYERSKYVELSEMGWLALWVICLVLLEHSWIFCLKHFLLSHANKYETEMRLTKLPDLIFLCESLRF